MANRVTPISRGASRRTSRSDASSTKQAFWAKIINAASRNPLAFFSLIVLVTEAMLGAALVRTSSTDQFKIIIVMVAVLVLLILAVTFIHVYRPGGFSKAEASTKTPYNETPLLETEKKVLVDNNRGAVAWAEAPPLSDDGLTRELLELRLVLHQAPRYATPTYYLDPHLSVIHWNVAFELIFKPILGQIHRRHVNYFIVELANHDAVFDHARDFTEKVKGGQLPLVDIEPLVYNSSAYGIVEFEKVATQLTDDDGHLKAWSVALFLKEIDWEMYRPDLLQRLRDDKLWGLYAVSYDAVLSDFTPYQELIKEVVRGLPPDAKRVLELGAGTGNVTRTLLQRNYRVTAVENNPLMLEKMAAKRLEQTGRLSIMMNSVDNLDLSDEKKFDGVVAVNVPYALDDPYACFRKVAESLKRDGMFVLSTTYDETNLDSLLAAIELELKAKGTFSAKEEHYRRVVAINKDIECTIAKRYSRAQYLTWLQQAGFQVIYNNLSYKDAVVVIHARKV